MRLAVALLVAVLLCVGGIIGGSVALANGEADKAEACRERGGVLIKTVDFVNGTVCARIEVVR